MENLGAAEVALSPAELREIADALRSGSMCTASAIRPNCRP